MRAKNGFTLVEILIVVVILGILAAIVIPQFTEASTEAKQTALCTDLQTLRSQIELYKIQHNDIPPSLDYFADQMTGYTDIDGEPEAAAGSGVYGPYIQKIPVNQFNDLDTVVAGPPTGTNGGGWAYIEATGAIYADDSYDPNHMKL
jgi:general secretion pathway protein G